MSIEEIEKNVTQIQENIKANLEKTLLTCLLDLQGKAQRLAPVDTGTLRGSASSSIDVNSIIGEVGFNEEYALEQHENLFFNHPKGGQAKYLEKPLFENAAKYKQALSEAAGKGIRL